MPTLKYHDTFFNEKDSHQLGDLVLIYLQILTTNIEGSVWQSVRRINILNLGMFAKGKDSVTSLFVSPSTTFDRVW